VTRRTGATDLTLAPPSARWTPRRLAEQPWAVAEKGDPVRIDFITKRQYE